MLLAVDWLISRDSYQVCIRTGFYIGHCSTDTQILFDDVDVAVLSVLIGEAGAQKKKKRSTSASRPRPERSNVCKFFCERINLV